MVQPWWIGGLAIPAVFIKGLANNRKNKVKEEEPLETRQETDPSIMGLQSKQNLRTRRKYDLSEDISFITPFFADEEGSDPSFLCERVCTSDRLLRRMGGLVKDPTPHTCVTVCGVSASDACSEACQRSVCANMHQVPSWNDACLKRCTTECIRGRAL